jgi:hypothetical protein
MGAESCNIAGCGAPVAEGPVPLCEQHLLAAHDWVAREVGITDLLPSPCQACGSRLGVRYPSGWLCAVCEWRVGEVPDEYDEPVRVDVVYYIRFDDRIKIGTSSNPVGRIAALPHHEVLAFERGDRRTERLRHEQFAGHRYAGSEWFRTHRELEQHIAALAEGVTDPWDRYRFWLSQEFARRR